jgi:mono/diheme cytochrome c family protein
MRHIWKILIGLVVAVLAVASYLLATGPHMIDQPNLRSYQARMPQPPDGSVPVATESVKPPTADEAARMTNPVPGTSKSRDRGRVYYQYYCIACHGDNGSGDGPVGVSYIPSPADLRSARVQSLSDGELYRAMLTGEGHAPVMGYTILPEHRWHLVNYLRSIGQGK